MTCLVETLKIYLEGKSLINYYVIKHLILLKIQSMMDINVDLLHLFITFLGKKSFDGAATRANESAIKSEIMSDQQLAKELYKPIIRKCGKEKASY